MYAYRVMQPSHSEVFTLKKKKHIPIQTIRHKWLLSHNGSKLGKKMSINRWVSKLWYIHRMEYFLAIKSSQLVVHSTTGPQNGYADIKQARNKYITNI